MGAYAKRRPGSRKAFIIIAGIAVCATAVAFAVRGLAANFSRL
jgi:hypothetical protein